MISRFATALLYRSNFSIIFLVTLLVTVGVLVLLQENRRYQTVVRSNVEEDLSDMALGLQRKLFEMQLMASKIETAAQSDLSAAEFRLEQAAFLLDNFQPEALAILAHVGSQSISTGEARVAKALSDHLKQVKGPGSTTKARIIGPLTLDNRDNVFVLCYAIGSSPSSGPSGGNVGAIHMVLPHHALFQRSGSKHEHTGQLTLALYDDKRKAPPITLVGEPSDLGTDPVVQLIASGDARWSMLAAPRGGWPALSRNFIPLLSFVVFAVVTVSGIIYWVRQLSKEKARAHILLKNGIEALDAGFVMFDEHGRLVLCNSQFADTFKKGFGPLKPGTSYEKLIKASAKGRSSEELGLPYDDWVLARLEGHKRGQEFLFKRRDGSWAKISETPTKDGFVVSVVADITELQEAKEAAETADAEKTEFLSNVTHELRTPLTVILGYTQLLSSGISPAAMGDDAEDAEDASSSQGSVTSQAEPAVICDAVKVYSKRIERSANHMLSLVNDLLDWAEVERERFRINRARVDIADIVNSVIEDLAPQAKERSLTLTGFSENACIMADPERVRQLIANLVGNAIKFTDEGRISVAATLHGDALSIIVSDTGCGIGKDDLPRVFDRFHQADTSSTRSHGGFGLGLAIAQKIVHAHGGSITAESTLGVGSKFSITLPVSAEALPYHERSDAA